MGVSGGLCCGPSWTGRAVGLLTSKAPGCPPRTSALFPMFVRRWQERSSSHNVSGSEQLPGGRELERGPTLPARLPAHSTGPALAHVSGRACGGGSS